MSERFTAASGRKVISRTSAEELGSLAHIVIDVTRGQVALLVIGKGRKARILAWEDVNGFGPDAVMIAEITVFPMRPLVRWTWGTSLDLWKGARLQPPNGPNPCTSTDM